jgi:hypothetical protein
MTTPPAVLEAQSAAGDVQDDLVAPVLPREPTVALRSRRFVAILGIVAVTATAGGYAAWHSA